ncbi:hypothetical protein [Streptomyces sp. 11x1]|uniref:hypothetical protein n=1 Tax=Streptomyces sp. 11x1 TaxID=3038642 RepID=UPI00292F9D00|nr:hypothetical protein [Streptomyces sp. 11x1]WNZ09076.1 hypothetical protein P8T65_16760 [Streptomyces sp. 11x1]
MTDSDAGTHGEREGREMPSGRTEPDMSDRPDNGERDDTSAASVPPSPEFRDAPSPAYPDTSPAAVRDTPSVDSLLAAAVRADAPADSAGEARAVAAFRAARESGGRTARTRRRDDWRPNARRRVQLSVRTTLAVLLASLTLGGVAFAAIGSAARGDKEADREHGSYENRERHDRTTDGAPTWPGPADVPRTAPPAPDSSGTPDQDGASRNPDESDRRADRQKDRQNDGKGTGGTRTGDGTGTGVGTGNGNGSGNGIGSGSGNGSGEVGADSRPESPRPGETNGPTGPKAQAAPETPQEARRTK